MGRGAREQRRHTLSIGAELAAARERAGLTVAEVSRRTKIREGIIGEIEAGDYTGCGGDFYARGFIRTIAQTVGADPAALVDEFDAGRGAPPAVTPPAVTRPGMLGPAHPVSMRGRRQLNVTAVLAVTAAIALAFAALLFLSASRHVPGASQRRQVAARPSAPAASPASVQHSHEIVVSLTAVQPCWIEFTTPAGSYLSQAYLLPGQSKTWTFPHAVAMRLGNPAGGKLIVNGKDPLPPNATQPITLMLSNRGSSH